MRLHLEALVLLQRVWGAFGVLAGASLALLAIGTRAALAGMGPLGASDRAAVGVFIVCAVVALGVGGGALFSARGLKRSQSAARRAALVLAIPNLIIVPFGTALGV